MDEVSRVLAAGLSVAMAQAHDSSRSIPYRMTYRLITGKVTASIFLQQVAYWWFKSNRKPFYKFRGPCSHKGYREGDSWTEELGFTVREVDGARNTLGVRCKKGDKKNDLKAVNLIVYWMDSSHQTWYWLNEELFALALHLAYFQPKHLEEMAFCRRLGSPDLFDFLRRVLNVQEVENLTGEALMTQIFGPRKTPRMEIPGKPVGMTAEEWNKLRVAASEGRMLANLHNNPHLSWGMDWVSDVMRTYNREDVPRFAIQEVGLWLDEHGMRPSPGEENTWIDGLRKLSLAAGREFAAIEEALTKADAAELDIATPHSLVKMTKAARSRLERAGSNGGEEKYEVIRARN